jgi:hypothetical protein
MVQRSSGVYPGFSRHAVWISSDPYFVNRKCEERPLTPYSKNRLIAVPRSRPAQKLDGLADDFKRFIMKRYQEMFVSCY